MTYTEKDIQSLNAELELAIQDTLADMPDVAEDDVWHDMVVAMAWQVEDDDLAREFCRRQLGYIPFDLEGRLGAIDYLDS